MLLSLRINYGPKWKQHFIINWLPYSVYINSKELTYSVFRTHISTLVIYQQNGF